MGEKKNRKRAPRISFGVSGEEYQLLKEKAIKSTTPLLSAYIRKIIFQGKITVFTRNQSLDEFMGEMIRLRNELLVVNKNYGQLINKLQDFEHYADIKNSLEAISADQQLVKSKIEEIKFHIAQFATSW
jgi:hypothetical protein